MIDTESNQPVIPARMAVNFKNDVSVKDNVIKIREFGVEVLSQKLGDTDKDSPAKRRGYSDIKGNIDLDKGQGKIDVVLENLDEDFVNVFAAPFLDDVSVKSILINAQDKIEFSDNFSILDASGSLTIDRISVIDEQTGGELIRPEGYDFQYNVKMKEDQLICDNITLKAVPREGEPETLLVTAELYRGNKQSEILVSSDNITIENFVPVAAAGATVDESEEDTQKTKTVSETEVESKEPLPGETDKEGEPEEIADIIPEEPDIPPVDLEGRKFKGIVDIKSMKWKNLDIKDFKIETLLANNIITVDPVSMVINEGTFQADAKVQVDIPGWEYNLNSVMRDVPTGPVIEAVSPDPNMKVTGNMDLNVNIEGRGTKPHNLQKYLKGSIKGQLKDGKVEGSSILFALSRVTKIAGLSNMVFSRGDVDLTIDEGKVNINTADFVGSLSKIGINGWYALNRRINLVLKVGLGKPLTKELQRFKYLGNLLTDDEGFIVFPSLIKMTGTIDKPRPSLAVSELLDDTGVNLLRDALQEGINKGLERLEGRRERGSKDKKD
jgi:hypothetical protein